MSAPVSLAKELGIGCGDNSCMWGSPGGMATNGGCRCIDRNAAHQDSHQQIRLGARLLRQAAADPVVLEALRALTRGIRQ